MSYSGYRFPAEIIHQAIWLYLRFTLSLRDRGVAVHVATDTTLTVLRDGSASGEPFRTDDRSQLAKASPEASHDVASGRGLSENRRPVASRRS